MEINISNSQLQWVEISAISPNPLNPRGPNVRDLDKDKDSLRESISQLGILVPLVIRQIGKNNYQIISNDNSWLYNWPYSFNLFSNHPQSLFTQ